MLHMIIQDTDIKKYRNIITTEEFEQNIQLLIDFANEFNFWNRDIEVVGELKFRPKYGMAGRGILKEKEVFENGY